MTSLTSLKHHTKIGKSKTESVLNFFPPLYNQVNEKLSRSLLISKYETKLKQLVLYIGYVFEMLILISNEDH